MTESLLSVLRRALKRTKSTQSPVQPFDPESLLVFPPVRNEIERRSGEGRFRVGLVIVDVDTLKIVVANSTPRLGKDGEWRLPVGKLEEAGQIPDDDEGIRHMLSYTIPAFCSCKQILPFILHIDSHDVPCIVVPVKGLRPVADCGLYPLASRSVHKLVGTLYQATLKKLKLENIIL